MSVYRDDVDAWRDYVQGELAKFAAVTGGETSAWRGNISTPTGELSKLGRYLKRANDRGFSSDEAAFIGPAHVVKPMMSTEFLQWWVESWGTERITLTQWRERAKEQREQVAWEDSADRALDQLETLKRLTLERDSIILDAAAKGATKVAIARSVGLSRQQVHNIIAAAQAPDVAPFTEWEQTAALAVEIAPDAVWGEVF